MKHVVIGGRTFRVDVYRDDAGNFVADARGPFRYTREDGSRSALVARAIAETPRHAVESVTTALVRMVPSSAA